MRTLAFVAALLVAAASTHAADTYTVDVSHSAVGFEVRHLVAKTRGRFKDFAANIQVDPAKPETSKVEFTIKTASIDTDEPKRDGHLKSPDFFDVEKHPEITFKSEKIVAKGKDQYEVTGPLTMKGVTKTVTLPVTVTGPEKDPWGNMRAGFETGLTLNRKDYGIVWNKTLDTGGLMLGDDVKVAIALETVAKPAAAATK